MATADSLLLVKKSRARTHHRVLRMLANAGKLDADLSAIVAGGLATLTIGRYLQRLRETELRDETSPVASGVIREKTLQLAAAIPQTREILSMLEDVSKRLSSAMEAPSEGYCYAARGVVPAHSGGAINPVHMLLFERERSPCHT